MLFHNLSYSTWFRCSYRPQGTSNRAFKVPPLTCPATLGKEKQPCGASGIPSILQLLGQHHMMPMGSRTATKDLRSPAATWGTRAGEVVQPRSATCRLPPRRCRFSARTKQSVRGWQQRPSKTHVPRALTATSKGSTRPAAAPLDRPRKHHQDLARQLGRWSRAPEGKPADSRGPGLLFSLAQGREDETSASSALLVTFVRLHPRNTLLWGCLASFS